MQPQSDSGPSQRQRRHVQYHAVTVLDLTKPPPCLCTQQDQEQNTAQLHLEDCASFAMWLLHLLLTTAVLMTGMCLLLAWTDSL
jgi:hypothetical protein